MKFIGDDLIGPLRDELGKYEACMKSAPSDPRTEPYRSKYAAMGCLENMQEKINTWDESEHQAAIQCAVLTAYGVLKTETEELSMGEKFLSRSLEICDKVQEEKFTILPRLRALIYLGVIWCGRESYEKSKDYLEKSLKVYIQFQEENSKEIYELRDLLYPRDYKLDAQDTTMESSITHAYFYLAQVEGKMGNSVKAAELYHITLDSQRKLPEFDWIDWAKNCAFLSQFYRNEENFTAARYHLAAALTMLDQHADDVEVIDLEGEKGDKEEKEKCDVEGDKEECALSRKQEAKRSAEAAVHLHCLKYGLCLLEYSHSELILHEEEKTDGPEKCSSFNTPEFSEFDVSKRLSEVTDQRIADFETARVTFLWTQKHTLEAQKFYTMDEKCSDYVDLTRDLSQLYKHLIAFEPDEERKSKMHRRRADLLEPLYKELSPTYYLLIIRQILFELGEIFSDMVDLKRSRWEQNKGNQHYAKKVNLLVNQAVLYFQTFLDTMKVDGKDPEKYSDDNVRPALLASFYLGRMASKYVVEENSPTHLNNINTTYINYKKIVDYCDADPSAAPKLQEALDACREMIKLLPVQMEKIRRSLTV